VGGNIVVVGVDFGDGEVEEDSGLLVEVLFGREVSPDEGLKVCENVDCSNSVEIDLLDCLSDWGSIGAFICSFRGR